MEKLRNNYPYALVMAAWCGYVALSLFNPQAQGARYSISEFQVDVIVFVVACAALSIWWVIASAALWLSRYAAAIKEDADGKAFAAISKGLWLLLLLVICQFALGVVPAYFKNGPWLNTSIVVNNHLPAFITLLSSGYFLAGSLGLRRITSRYAHVLPSPLGVQLPFISFSLLFLWYMYTNISQVAVVDAHPKFVTPARILVVSIGLPYVLSWALGLLAVWNITNYAKNVKGILYRRALVTFAQGFVMVLCNTILLQFLAVNAKLVSTRNLELLLVLIGLLVVIYAMGFAAMLRGTKQLHKLEKLIPN